MNTQLTGFFLFALIATFPILASAQESDGRREVNEAIIMLEGKIPFAATDEAKSRLEAAVEALRQIVPEPKMEDDPAIEITARALQRKLNGKVAFNEKTSEITILYDFRNAKQFEDFEGYDPSVARRGSLALPGATQVKHVIEFETFSVAGLVNYSHSDVTFISSNAGYRIERRVNGFSIHIGDKQKAHQYTSDGEVNNKTIPYRLEFTDSKIVAKIGTIDIAASVDAVGTPRVGRVAFGPCVGTVYYGPMTIVGKIDRQWAQQFLAGN